MQITRQSITDVLLLEPCVHADTRGYFMESWRKNILEDFLGHQIDFCQDNESSSLRGVLRGLHFQSPPYAQSKLIRVLEGEILDVAVDIRFGSPTYGQHVAMHLSAENRHQLFVPRGFAHGFVVLSDMARCAYKVDNYYSPDNDMGIIFDDPLLNIDWQLPGEQLSLSLKDQQLPSFADLPKIFDYSVARYD